MDERRCVEVLRSIREDGCSVSVSDWLSAVDHAIATIERCCWLPVDSAPWGVVVWLLTEGSGVRAAHKESTGEWVFWSPWCVTYSQPGKLLGWRPLPDPQPDGQEG